MNEQIYNIYGYPNETPLITRGDQFVQIVKEAVADIEVDAHVDLTEIEVMFDDKLNALSENIDTKIQDAVDDLSNKIDEAKTEILEEMPSCCCQAVKEEIGTVVSDLTDNIDEQFNNLNEMVSCLQQNGCCHNNGQ